LVPGPPGVIAYLGWHCALPTAARRHSQAPSPQLSPCRRCRSGAECTVEPDEDTEPIGLPVRSKIPPRKDHWTHVCERRTEAELERLLAGRLALLRAGRLHQGPCPE